MNIGLINMQMPIPRSAEAAQVQHNLNQANALQQSFEDIRQKEDAKLKQKQVRKKDDTAGITVRDDQNRKNNGGYSGKDASKNEDMENDVEENVSCDPLRGHHIDVLY